ncbi:hypothetical protein JCM14469_04630 [Desulfatiferula olefinivorans]
MNVHPTQSPFDFLTLAFKGEWKHLEPLYIDHRYHESLTRIRIVIVLALVFYLLFAVLDAILVPQQKWVFWAIRFILVGPLFLWALWFSYRPSFIRYNQHCFFFVSFMAGAGIVLMVILADPPATYSYYAGIILVFITIYTFIQMRFLWAVACSWLIFLVYEIGAIWFARTPAIMLINNNFFFVSANIFCMLSGYSIEINSRTRFFSTWKLEQTKNELADINRELDERVQERTRELEAVNASLNIEIQERIRSEENRIRMEKEFSRKQKLEAIGILAGGIAHDFNNILSAVIGFSEVLLDSLDETSDEHRYATEILNGGIRAGELVRQILTFSSQTEEDVRPVPVGPVVSEALKLIRATIPAEIAIIPIIESKAWVMADESQLHRIVMNLCTNAYHAIGDKRGTITVRVKTTVIDRNITWGADSPEPGEYVTLTVIDTGCGMPTEVLEKIFDPFFTTKAPDQGTGMGLSVVHGVVKSYRGGIHVWSEPGRGSTFVVYLPVTTISLGGKNADCSDLPRGTESIMIVDDEPALVLVMQRKLESLGYKTEGFSDSEEALHSFTERPEAFDLIISDCSMPRLSGIELAESMLAIRKDLPIILCTGYTKNITQREIKTRGIRSLLMKPVSRLTIASAVRAALDSDTREPKQ